MIEARESGRVLVRRSAGLWAYEQALARAGFSPVAGIDEAGRGACAGPLVVAAAVLPAGRRGLVPGLADSKLLTAKTREAVYAEVTERALSWCVITIPPAVVDERGLHVVNVEGMRRALAGLSVRPQYALIDGFPVPGLGMPAIAMWKGDRVAASVAAAGILAKVTRDRMMAELHETYPVYDFATSKGYITAAHSRALQEYGPCLEHRFSYVNVAQCSADRSSGESASGDLESGAGRDHDGSGSLPEFRAVPRRTIRRLEVAASAQASRHVTELRTRGRQEA